MRKIILAALLTALQLAVYAQIQPLLYGENFTETRTKSLHVNPRGGYVYFSNVQNTGDWRSYAGTANESLIPTWVDIQTRASLSDQIFGDVDYEGNIVYARTKDSIGPNGNQSYTKFTKVFTDGSSVTAKIKGKVSHFKCYGDEIYAAVQTGFVKLGYFLETVYTCNYVVYTPYYGKVCSGNSNKAYIADNLLTSGTELEFTVYSVRNDLAGSSSIVLYKVFTYTMTYGSRETTINAIGFDSASSTLFVMYYDGVVTRFDANANVVSTKDYYKQSSTNSLQMREMVVTGGYLYLFGRRESFPSDSIIITKVRASDGVEVLKKSYKLAGGLTMSRDNSSDIFAKKTSWGFLVGFDCSTTTNPYGKGYRTYMIKLDNDLNQLMVTGETEKETGKEETTKRFSAYPTVNGGTFTVNCRDRSLVRAFDVRGNLVGSFQAEMGTNEVSLDVPSGVYFIKSGCETAKIVIRK